MSKKNQGHILVVAPARGRGGIASVVRLHSQTDSWQTMRCRLLSTYDDRSTWQKMIAAAKAYVSFPFVIRNAVILHVHLAAQKSVFRKLPFILLAKLLDKPVIVHLHAFSPESIFDDTMLSAGRYILRLADRVVALSESWADAILARDRSLNVSVIPNPVSATSLRSSRSPEYPIVLFAGKLEIRKGYQDLLRAAVPILTNFPNTQFWFAGHGELENAAELAQRLGIQDSVRLLGWLDEEGMSKAYNAATVFCLPSYNEGVPMVVLEAMGRGMPVVCTRVGGLPDFVRDGENGLYAEPGDPASIAAAITRLLSDPIYASKIGQNAAQTVHSRCGLASVSKQLEDLYTSVLTEQSRKRVLASRLSPIDAAVPLAPTIDAENLHEGSSR